MTDRISSQAGPESQMIEVAVALPLHGTYTYSVPALLKAHVVVGKRVLVPFGRRQISGYVLGPAAGYEGNYQIKDISDILDPEPLFPESMVPFFRWVADYYIHPLGEVIRTALPGGLNVTQQAVYRLSEAGGRALSSAVLDSTDRTLLTRLSQGPCSLKQLQRVSSVKSTRAKVNTLVAQGWVVRDISLTSDRTRPKTERFFSASGTPEMWPGLSKQRKRLAALLNTQGAMSLAQIKAHIPSAGHLVRTMVRDGQLEVRECPVYRDPLGEPISPDRPPRMTDEQRQAVETMSASLGVAFDTYLLSGVTGSGKTEVYLQMAARALDKESRVLVLVPEIALVSQIERAFRARFGDRVALLHSGLSNGERFDQWRRISRAEASIAIGARSAVFAPFAHVGLVIVDEEHDDSYKQEGSLRYNARDLAVVRAQQDSALAILGSATPSVQSAYNAQIGKFRQVTLSHRVDQRVLPQISVADLGELREERGLRRFLTPALVQTIQDTLARKEQVLLFLNRRGFASALVCSACGQPLRCDRCDISLTYHQHSNAYRCHYCGFSRAAVSRCTRCGSSRINRLGLGTEKLEAEIQPLFPGARVARMDRDTTRRKGAVLKILKALRQRKIDILVGTQMVAKGHDYPGITLVGIICADLSLSLPDFRAGERTFQLLAQVAGRAGRGDVPGQVILQTYNPDHFSIIAARHQDFSAFYRQEIQFRKALGYPPFRRMIQVRIHGIDKARTAEFARRLGERCAQLKGRTREWQGIDILGPIEAPLSRIANQYRWQLLLKGAQVHMLHQFARQLLFSPDDTARSSEVGVSVDVDPVFLL